jgi:hypothetical protein
MKAFVFVLISFLLVSSAWAEPVFNTYLDKEGNLLVSYHIEGKASEEFFDHVTDTLKSGKNIQIIHNIALKSGKFFPRKLAETERNAYISYDLLASSYSFNQGEQIVFGNEASAREETLSTEKAALSLKEPLVVGDEYRIEVNIFTREVEKTEGQPKWKKWLNKVELPSFTRTKLSYEVPYIAR